MKNKSTNFLKLFPCGSLFLLCLLIFYGSTTQGQSINSDSAWKMAHKNIIRYNLSGALLFGADKYIVFGYERLLNPHQSFSINAGPIAMPKLVSFSSDSFYMKRTAKNDGFNFSVDYRFYLKNENKYGAPRGVYIGPYYSYNQFRKNNDWIFKEGFPDEQPVNTSFSFNIHTIGAELGYQFVFWNRMAVDLVMIGPGLSNYYIKAKIDANITEENKQKLNDALQGFLNDKYPGFNYAIDEGELSGKGLVSTWSAGYRFLIHIGYSF